MNIPKQVVEPLLSHQERKRSAALQALVLRRRLRAYLRVKSARSQQTVG